MAMGPPGRRHDRIASEIRDLVGAMVSNGELKDPRIGFTTVTRVELSPDLSHARVLISVLEGEEAQQATLAGLVSATGFVRREIGRRLRLRRTPEVVFALDHGPEEAERLETLLRGLKRQEPAS